MPHSVSPEGTPLAEDSTLPDAPTAPLSEQGENPGDLSGDVTMEINGGEMANSVSQPRTDEVKLEDLFNNDEDEDEEFPSSGASDAKVASSPPQHPMCVKLEVEWIGIERPKLTRF